LEIGWKIRGHTPGPFVWWALVSEIQALNDSIFGMNTVSSIFFRFLQVHIYSSTLRSFTPIFFFSVFIEPSVKCYIILQGAGIAQLV
jgi:hypothetical protein